MTNLEVLRLLPAEQMAEYLAEQRMCVARVALFTDALEKQGRTIEEIESQVKAMFLEWLRKEATL